jgi:hypothetical protein
LSLALPPESAARTIEGMNIRTLLLTIAALSQTGRTVLAFALCLALTTALGLAVASAFLPDLARRRAAYAAAALLLGPSPGARANEH